jgi:Isochorismatase family
MWVTPLLMLATPIEEAVSVEGRVGVVPDDLAHIVDGGSGRSDMLLENVGAKNVVLMGINTNTCVLNTGFTAFNKNYRVVVLSECVATMYMARICTCLDCKTSRAA